jgi:hypothetical protein
MVQSPESTTTVGTLDASFLARIAPIVVAMRA